MVDEVTETDPVRRIYVQPPSDWDDLDDESQYIWSRNFVERVTALQPKN